jgi:outer membrane protein assembly factor BamB
VLDPANLGKFSNPSKGIQTMSVGGHVHGGPVYWQSPAGPTIYIWPEGEGLKAFRFNGNQIVTTPAVENADFKPAHPGGVLTLSSNGATAGTGVIWATSAITAAADAWHQLVPGMLQAYDATTLTKVWTSNAKAADALGTFAKFNAPIIINGKVYVGTNSSALQVYGIQP